MDNQDDWSQRVGRIADRLEATDPEAAALLRNLVVGMEHRSTIGQAIGIVRERYGLDAHTAFAVLSRIAEQEQVKVRDISSRVVPGESFSIDAG